MPTDPRIHVTFRMAPKGVDWLDQIARENQIDRSTAIRLALAVARKHEGEIVARIKEEA